MPREIKSYGIGGLGLGEFPADSIRSLRFPKNGENGTRVNPFQEDLLDLFGKTKGKGELASLLEQLIGEWQGTARVKELLIFGLNYHRSGSVQEALAQMSPSVPTEPMSISGRSEDVKGDVFGIIGRRVIRGGQSVFDCVVATDFGLHLATLSHAPETGLRFAFRRGFEPGRPTQAIEDVVVPKCKKTK